MREEFRAELLEIGRLLVSMAEAVRTAMRRATEGLLSADRDIALEVVERDAEIDALYRQVEENVYGVLARQAPVASDLRMVVTALNIGADLERMGDLADHVARTALRRHPAAAVPGELIPIVQQMTQVADRIAGKITGVLSAPDAARAAELAHDDDAMDSLHRKLFATVLAPDWPHGVEAAVDSALLSRFFERYADHAVNAGNRMVFFLTGEPVGNADA